MTEAIATVDSPVVRTMFATAAIHTKNLEQHRVPGVCVSLIGFSLVFTGVMMMGISSTLKESSGRQIQVAGPCCLAIGGAMVIAGFTTQYVLHKRHKKRLMARLKKTREQQTKRIVSVIGNATGTGRARKYLSEDVVLPSTSHDIVPSITVETMIESGDFFTTPPVVDVGNGVEHRRFVHFREQRSSFDDSSDDDDDDYMRPRQTQTKAVIEHPKPSEGPKEGLRPQGSDGSKAPSTLSVRDLAGVKQGAVGDMSSPTLAKQRREQSADSQNKADQRASSNVNQTKRSNNELSEQDEQDNWDSSTESLSEESSSSRVSDSSATKSGSANPRVQSHSHLQNNEKPQTLSLERQRSWVESSRIGENKASPGSKLNGSQRSRASRMLTTSWIASDQEDMHSFVESLSRSSSFAERKGLSATEDRKSESIQESPSFSDSQEEISVKDATEERRNDGRMEHGRVDSAKVVSNGRNSEDGSLDHISNSNHVSVRNRNAAWSKGTKNGEAIRPREGKGKMTKHNKCKNPRKQDEADSRKRVIDKDGPSTGSMSDMESIA